MEDAPRFDEWLLLERERLRHQMLNAYHQTCTAYVKQQAWQSGVSATKRWLALDDLDETGHRYLMRCLAEQGQHRAALAQYQTCRQLLVEELGLEPEPETMALYEQIKSMPLATTKQLGLPQSGLPQSRMLLTSASSPTELSAIDSVPSYRRQPHDWGEAPNNTAFYGREAELAELEGWLIRDRCRLVTILGIGGQGKTSLAAMSARSLADQYDGVFWRSLLNAPPVESILHEALQYLSPEEMVESDKSLHQMLTRLLDYLRQGRYLLVLDNVESILQGEKAGHYRPGYDGYGQFLQRVGAVDHGNCLLLTSRERPHELAR